MHKNIYTVLTDNTFSTQKVIPKIVYSGTLYFVRNVLASFGVEFTCVNGSDPSAYQDAVKPNTKVCYVVKSVIVHPEQK